MVASALTVTFVSLCFELGTGGTGPNYMLCPTAWLRLLLEKLTVSHLVKNFPSDWAREGRFGI